MNTAACRQGEVTTLHGYIVLFWHDGKRGSRTYHDVIVILMIFKNAQGYDNSKLSPKCGFGFYSGSRHRRVEVMTLVYKKVCTSFRAIQ